PPLLFLQLPLALLLVCLLRRLPPLLYLPLAMRRLYLLLSPLLFVPLPLTQLVARLSLALLPSVPLPGPPPVHTSVDPPLGHGLTRAVMPARLPVAAPVIAVWRSGPMVVALPMLRPCMYAVDLVMAAAFDKSAIEAAMFDTIVPVAWRCPMM